MIGKKVAATGLTGLVCLSLFGCGTSRSNEKDERLDQIAAQHREMENREMLGVNLTQALNARNELQKYDVNGIGVSKEELDKLIPIARYYKLNEEELRYVAALMKKCGVDFTRMDSGDSGFSEGRQSVVMRSKPGEIPMTCSVEVSIMKNKNENKFYVESIHMEGGNGLQPLDGIKSVRMDVPLLSLHEFNNAEEYFIKTSSLIQMKNDALKTMKEKGATNVFIGDARIQGIPYFDKEYKNIYFANRIAFDILYDAPTEVYGGEPKHKSGCVYFDFNGQLARITEGLSSTHDIVDEKMFLR